MFATATIVLPEKPPVVTIPETAVDYTLYGDSVFLITEKKGEDGKDSDPNAQCAKGGNGTDGQPGEQGAGGEEAGAGQAREAVVVGAGQRTQHAGQRSRGQRLAVAVAPASARWLQGWQRAG